MGGGEGGRGTSRARVAVLGEVSHSYVCVYVCAGRGKNANIEQENPLSLAYGSVHRYSFSQEGIRDHLCFHLRGWWSLGELGGY